MNESIHPVENFGSKIAPRQRSRSLNRSYTLAINVSKFVIDAGRLGAAQALEGTRRRETEGAKRRHELSRILWWELLDRFQTLSDLDWWD